MKVSRTVVLGVGLAVLIVLAGGYQLGVLSPGFGKQAANCAQIASLYGLCEPGPGASVTPVPLIAKLANDSGTVNIPGDSPNLSVAPFASLGTVLWIATDGEAVVAAYELPNFQGGCALIGESGIATTFLFTLPELKGKLGSVRLGKRGGNFGCSALILYEAWNYQGRFISFAGEYERLADLGFDKIASSARVAGPLINNRPYTLYSEPSFSGRCSTIRGDVPQLNALGVGNDQASSVSPSRACRIGVPVSLELHDAPQMGGDKVLFENDVPDLSVIGFNDKTVSLTAQGAARIALYSNPGYQGICLSARGLSIPNLASTVLGNNSLSSFKYGDCPEPEANGPVTLWAAWNYGGDAFSVVQDIPDLRIVNFDNVASSVKVASGSRVALYSEPNYTGVCSSVAVDVPQLNPLPV
ncbi:MAG: beta/gamma crystallin-related protein, partial [Chloroflexi bacterium]|nr:beta/gamma crystallin-related protein [Chloroflexota bacterium]